jgi:hypothetical protein
VTKKYIKLTHPSTPFAHIIAMYVLTSDKLELQVKVATLTNRIWEQSIAIANLERQIAAEYARLSMTTAVNNTVEGEIRMMSP